MSKYSTKTKLNTSSQYSVTSTKGGRIPRSSSYAVLIGSRCWLCKEKVAEDKCIYCTTCRKDIASGVSKSLLL